MTSDQDRVELQLEADWSAAAEVEEQVATQFLVQIGLPAGGRPDGVHLVIGHGLPPLVTGDDVASRQAQVDRLGGKLPIKIHGRYFITRARLEDLRNSLNRLAQTYDELQKASGGEEA